MKQSVIITGAASGIGAAILMKYINNTSMHIFAIDINGTQLLTMKEAMDKEQQSRLDCIAIDLTDQQAIEQQLLRKIEPSGIAHVVISHAVGFDNRVDEDAKWEKILNVNLMATQKLFSAIGDKINDDGRVVVMSSVLGKVGKINNTGYVTSKHALLGLVKALALDWARRKITVNAVLPCWVDTSMMRKELEQQASMVGLSVDNMLRKIKKSIPLRSLIQADDVADTVMFLTSPQAKMITAQSIVIDGGFGCGL